MNRFQRHIQSFLDYCSLMQCQVSLADVFVYRTLLQSAANFMGADTSWVFDHEEAIQTKKAFKVIRDLKCDRSCPEAARH